jgi:hypothetical protein
LALLYFRFLFAYDTTSLHGSTSPHCGGRSLRKFFSGGEDDVLGSTESLFAAWAHCARMSGARQREWLCIPSENVQKFFDEEKFKEKRRIQRKERHSMLCHYKRIKETAAPCERRR